MRTLLLFIFLISSQSFYSQKGVDLVAIADSITAEGKMLYTLETTSWYGTDIFLANYEDTNKVGGYFSYLQGDVAKCVFFSNELNPTVIATISFVGELSIKTSGIDLEERSFTSDEYDLYLLRSKVTNIIYTDAIFSHYENTSLNIIPLITEIGEKKVYVITGSNVSDIVAIGNDYLLTFDTENNLLTKEKQHKGLITFEYHSEGGIATTHSHLSEYSPFITTTDVCTLLLYQKYTNWQKHYVISDNYISIWDYKTNSLTIIDKDDAMMDEDE